MDIDAATAVSTVVQSLLPPNSGPVTGFQVTLSYAVYDHNDPESDEVFANGDLTLLFRRTFNYMTVWAATGRSPQPADFKFVGNHDSGWRGLVATETKNLVSRVRADFEAEFGKRANTTPHASMRQVGLIELATDGNLVLSLK